MNDTSIDLDSHLAGERRNLEDRARQDMQFDLDAFLNDYGIRREAARAARRERARVIGQFLAASKRALFGERRPNAVPRTEMRGGPCAEPCA